MNQNDNLERTERFLDEQRDREIARIREAAKSRELQPIGRCYFCDGEVEGQALFCPPDPEFGSCQEDYERHQRARRYAGR